MYLSIIIPTSNRSQELSNAIESLTKQTLSQDTFEVIVVENGSAINAKEITENFRNKIKNLYYFYEPVPGLLAGRHRGVSEAQGDILVFIDDDIIADNGWLEAVAQTFEDRDIQLVGGRNLPWYETEPPEWMEAFWITEPDGGKWCGYLSLLDFGDKYRIIDPSLIWGLNFSIRKETLISLGGFHPDGYPWDLRRFRGDGEMVICRKAKELALKSVYQPDALLYHVIPKNRMTIEYFEKRSYLQGISDSYTKICKDSGLVNHETNEKALNWKALFQKLKKSAAYMLDNPYEETKKRVKTAYHAGYEFHRNEVLNDPQLLEWVLKDDYWDYKLPIQVKLTQ